jgi:hypothetical protein
MYELNTTLKMTSERKKMSEKRGKRDKLEHFNMEHITTGKRKLREKMGLGNESQREFNSRMMKMICFGVKWGESVSNLNEDDMLEFVETFFFLLLFTFPSLYDVSRLPQFNILSYVNFLLARYLQYFRCYFNLKQLKKSIL